MYMEEGVTITKADDDSIVMTFRVKTTKKKSEGDKSSEVPIYDKHETKTFTAKDVDDAVTQLKKILPLMKAGYMEEEAFSKAFKEASKDK